MSRYIKTPGLLYYKDTWEAKDNKKNLSKTINLGSNDMKLKKNNSVWFFYSFFLVSLRFLYLLQNFGHGLWVNMLIFFSVDENKI